MIIGHYRASHHCDYHPDWRKYEQGREGVRCSRICLIGIAEDPVTGSASSFAAKYWATRAGVGSGQVVKVTQVSHRDGDLDVIWDEHLGTARLRGNARLASRGEIYL